MPHMARVFDIRFHQAPQPGQPFKWHISDNVEIFAMSEATAVRLARRALGLDDTWHVRKVLDHGPWNKFDRKQEAQE